MKAVPGLNAVHEWDGLVRLNDNAVFPRVRLRRIPGWNTRPEMNDIRDKGVGRPMREIPRRTQLEGKPLVYEGKVEAQSQDELEEYLALLSHAFSTTQERVMSVQPYYSDETYFYTARITAYDPPEEYPDSDRRVTMGYERAFMLGLRMADPRKYRTNGVEVVAGSPAGQAPPPSEAGLTIPFMVGSVIPAQTLASPVEELPWDYDYDGIWVFNEGSAETDPHIQARADSLGVVDISNASLGRRLRATGLPAYNIVDINFATRSILANGVDYGDNLSAADTDWWDAGVEALRSGWNKITGATSVRFNPAYF